MLDLPFEIYFETYGCTANYNSTEIMKGIIKQSGLNITNNLDFADFIVINSCIVKGPTEERIRRRFSDLLKKGKKIILAGCMPRLYKDKLQKENLYLIDTSHIKNIAKLIYDIQNNSYQQDKYLKSRNEVKVCLPKISKEKYIGITQISEGCLGNCTYCITKLAKGELFSYPDEKILESIKNDLNTGCKEIWITSQDCAAYGNEEGNYLLPKLLKEIISLNKKFFLRIGMMNPDNMLKILPELIEIYKNEKILKFLHIPVQSGSNNILKEMNRKYSPEEILKIVSQFREKFPNLHLATDIIVGYPGETKEDFIETFNLIKKIKPETLNISKFWSRPYTPASKIKQNLSPDLIKKRVIKLAELHKEICIREKEKYLNKEFRVLVNKKGLLNFPDTFLARDENYRLFVVFSKKEILGKFINIKVKKITSHYLISEVLV